MKTSSVTFTNRFLTFQQPRIYSQVMPFKVISRSVRERLKVTISFDHPVLMATYGRKDKAIIGVWMTENP